MATIGHNKPPVTSLEALTPADRKRVKQVIQVLNDSMTRVAAEKDVQKGEIEALSKTLGLDRKLLRRMAKVYFKANYDEEVDQDENFQKFYDGIIKEDSK